MPYAIRIDGWRAVSDDFQIDELLPGEELANEIPQELLNWDAENSIRLALVRLEQQWQSDEISFVNNQLMAIEETAETGEDTGALPGTRGQWLSYRTKIRNWKEEAENYPFSTYRPARPT